MDRIKDLILERIQHSHQLKNKCEQIFDYQDIYQAKKAEKLRQIKENELIEALFNFGQASKCERQLFEVHSSDVMNSLNYQFNYKPKNRGLFSDIAEMYILFFDSIQLQTRVEEIRIIAKYNLYQNFPFLCMLFKWLIEISRKVFMDIMAIVKTNAASCKKKRPNNQQTAKYANNLQSSQEHLKSAKLDQKNQNNLTATTASQNTQDSFNNESENRVNINQIKLNPLSQEVDYNKKKLNEDAILMKKQIKNGQKEQNLLQSTKINKENSCEGSKNAHLNNMNHTTSGLNIQPKRDNQFQQHKENSSVDKFTSTLPFQSDYSPKLQIQQKPSSLASSNQRRSLRITNSYTHKHSMDYTDIQVQDKDISHLMSATQNLENFNLSDLEDDDEDNIEDEDDSQMVVIRQTQSQIFKNGDKLNNTNLICQDSEQDQSSINNLVSSNFNKTQQQKDQTSNSQKQKVANDFLKHLGKPNIEKLKRRKRDMFFNNIKECLYDVEFVVPKCNDYLINFYIKLMFQRNIQVKTSIDAYKVKYWQKFNNTFAKLDPGLIYTEQDKINAEEQLRASLNESSLQQQPFGSLDQLQKSTSQFIQSKNDQSLTNQIINNLGNQQNKRTCSTLSPINRPIGSDKKSSRIVIETSKSNNFTNLSQNVQNNLNSGEKDKKRFRTYSYVGNNSVQVQQLQLYQQQYQQEKSLSPLSQNIPFNQQFSKEFQQQNSVQQQVQLLPQFLQRNSPEIRRQNIKNSKYTNCIIPAVKNFDTSEIEPNSFNANHIFNTKHSNILKGKQSKFQKNLMMMKIEKTFNQQTMTQFQQFNSDLNGKKGEEIKNTNMIQNNTFFHQNSNIFKKIHTNDISLSNIIMTTGKKSQQYSNNINNNNSSALDININSQIQNNNSAGGSSCIILQQMNKTTSNIQETLNKSATKNSSFPLNQQNVIQEEELSKSPHLYHLNRMKYRPPKNPKILLQKINNNTEDQISSANNFNNLTNLQNTQQKSLNHALQVPLYNNNNQQFGMHGPIITSFQNDLIDLQTKQLLKKPQQQNLQIESFNGNGGGGVTALKNRKILTQPEENIAISSNEKLNLSLTSNNNLKSRSASGKAGKEENMIKAQANKYNLQIKQNLLTSQINGPLNQEILKQIGAYSIQNNTNFNKNYIQNNDNSIFPFLKDLISQPQDNIQKYF
ncbi:hypothetical protein TTHERM_01207710 (macronuclear) [Tetrahymena thermophila SB210]|uniref:Uncharacterized protein n=1 Tax=Tetrahymena thermophila (strain SB210) TaxID=312017 RepID=Q23YQ1_TETTS|nr:hypothetical protein TTHERM_01207710 [Tetrahymena thermophila SB210]EAS01671.1 hypothetical protein TTHERM_01207710 [Tetrahymena thermophila SB210]|eukprot:XP_001021916.1 hypothetical protein TTHERM_01207710 [Tetrahymena thermophila SB210]